jgi:hypothetical protein
MSFWYFSPEKFISILQNEDNLYTNEIGTLPSSVQLDRVSYITCQFEGQYPLQSPTAVNLDHLTSHTLSYFLKFRQLNTAFEVIRFSDCFPTLLLINKFDN